MHEDLSFTPSPSGVKKSLIVSGFEYAKAAGCGGGTHKIRCQHISHYRGAISPMSPVTFIFVFDYLKS